ncbi:radical SAM protein [candidate division KSB3 bacterium]|uniref:Radical SAM protein n=1 Tax=candidate division KSB3 bacterium TaxID=2044937 RepID=A0A9D5JV54_9BACT|nr:radical SAM protein [candidate division KSB3 bacterium]MBD3324834.1 radical SAM protein [candidate division KSB3 bacterium]
MAPAERSSADTLMTALTRKSQGEPVWRYFDHRVRHPAEAKARLPFVRCAPLDTPAVVDQMFQAAPVPARRRVLYLHIPFCTHLCDFCGYTRCLGGDQEAVTRYLDALRAQLRRYSDTPWGAAAAPVEAIYLGGGTPTALPAAHLAALLTDIAQRLPVKPTAEVTVESCLSSLEPEDIPRLREAGVNRMSFGVQSFDTHLRRSLGRVSDREHILTTLQQAKHQGLETICIDLLYNLPHQTLDTWQQDLRTLAATPVTGCSVYPLILFPHARLARQIQQGDRPPLGSLEREYQFYTAADAHLADVLHWQRFTPVQYGDARVERARYVRAHSRNDDVLALGAGAGGAIGARTYRNTPDIAAYIAAQEHADESQMMVLTIDPTYLEARRWYQLSEGLRAPSETETAFALVPAMHEVIRSLLDLELVLQSPDGGFTLTQTGRFWAGNISALISEAIGDALHTQSIDPAYNHKDRTWREP